jgi:membrane protein YqaA with SNARE-associated domain
VTPEPPFSTDRPSRSWQVLAFVWGLAEATCFFIVPDVLCSRLVLRQPRQGFTACFTSLAGALVGGALLYFLGRDPARSAVLLAAMDWLPGISPELGEQARQGLASQGPGTLFLGALNGIPYKLYAIQAASTGLGFVTFMLTSIGARLARFLAVTGLAWLIGAKILPNLSVAAKLHIHFAFWGLFYFAYFGMMGV